MNKFTCSLALATGLTVGLAASAARADAIQSLSTADMSASTFNNLFQPLTGTDSAPLSSSFTFNGAPVSGTMESQVFQGTGAATGLYAYAYQFDLNKVNDSSGQPVNLYAASWQFNSTPVGTNLSGTPNTYAYVVSDGAVGGLSTPQAASGQPILAPTQINWEPNTTIGSILATYFDPTTKTPALLAGGNSATFVVLSTQPPTTQLAGILGSDPIAPNSSLTSTYSPQAGSIEPIPAPEPSALLAWAGLAGAVALVRRFRQSRAAAIA
jgi:hypothetical protein